MPAEYAAQILKLRLPEQDALKNDAERCSADPTMLNWLDRAVGHQVRIKRKDVPGFFALYTVKQANPTRDLSDPSRAQDKSFLRRKVSDLLPVQKHDPRAHNDEGLGSLALGMRLQKSPAAPPERWSRLSEQNFRVDKWSVCRG